MGYLERARLGQIWQPWYAALMEQGGLVGRIHGHIVAFSALFMPLWYHCSLELGKRSVASVNASMEQLNCVFCKKHVPVLYIIQVVDWHRGTENSLLAWLIRLLLRHHSWVV